MESRRTETIVEFEGVNISKDINKDLLSITYTDNEEDKADDIQLSISDTEGHWIKWLAQKSKGATIRVLIMQKNWHSDGKSKLLDCGTFELDTIDVSGPPTLINLKGTSIPYKSTLRSQKKSRAWENTGLKNIGEDISKKNGLKCFFDSKHNPRYARKEQVNQSDIAFLKTLCKSAGVSLKVASNAVIMFDAAEYESKDAVRSIQNGKSDVLSYSFSTSFNDAAYDKSHVVYTKPNGKKIEYTYKPRRPPGSGQTLEIREKVKDREEARQLAMKRLREKNKKEFTASFTLVGDVNLVAGVTVKVAGYGAFDGKYIVESAAHSPIGGYTTNIKLRKVLEGY